jgi:hypothetical protein
MSLMRRNIMATWVGVNGPDGTTATGVAANYLKAQPSTQFGTRQLTVLNIAQTGVETNYANPNSLFSKTIRAIQQTAEIWAVFTPTTDAVKVIISTDSQWDGVGAPQTSQGGTAGDASYTAMEASILAGSGTAATVTVPAGFVAPFAG